MEPADRLRVDVEYNVADAKYSPGQKVELTIQAKSEENVKDHKEDIFYNVKVIDSGVFTEAKRKCFPPSLPAMLLLEDEILKDNAEHEFHYPQEYIDLYFTRYTALNQEPVTLKGRYTQYIYIYIQIYIYIYIIYRRRVKFGATIRSPKLEKVYFFI